MCNSTEGSSRDPFAEQTRDLRRAAGFLQAAVEAAFDRSGREQRVLLHLVPHRLAAHHARERLERVVEAVEQQSLAAVEQAFAAAQGGIAQEVAERGPEIGSSR